MLTQTKEDFPTNALKPRGKSMQSNCFVVSNHASDRMMRRSQTVILIFGNSVHLFWYTNK